MFHAISPQEQVLILLALGFSTGVKDKDKDKDVMLCYAMLDYAINHGS